MKKKIVKSGQLRKRRSPILVVRETREKVGTHFSERFVRRLSNVREVRLWVVEWALLVLVVFLLAIVQMIWYGESYEREAYVKGGDFSEATLGKVSSLNPLYAVTSSEKTLAKLMFANLVSPDVSGHIKGELAKSVTMDDSGKIWTVTLKDEIYWSDGEPINADDVIFTTGLISNRDAKTTIPVDFANTTIEKVDDKVVRFTLPTVYVDFADTLEFPLVPKHILGDISPALIYESDFSTSPVVSGPFALNAMQVDKMQASNAQTFYLNRNDRYFGAKATLNSFTVKAYETKDEIIGALRNLDVMATAELDAGVNDLPFSINYRESRVNGAAFAFLNTRDGELKNVKIRQAIRRIVDIDKVLGEDLASFRVDYPFLAEQGENLQNPELPLLDYEAAKNLLGEAGYHEQADGKYATDDGTRLKLNLAVQNRGKLGAVAEAFTQQLRDFGIEVVLNSYDSGQSGADFFSTVVKPRDYDILFYEMDLGLSVDPYLYYSSRQANESGWNLSNYNNNLVDDALISGRTTTDMALRKAKYESFLRRWVDEVPAIALYQSTAGYYYNASARIYSEDSRLTDVLDRFADVSHWATARSKVNITP